jgi:MiaB/RimO family radical SAM methylthiotransferase
MYFPKIKICTFGCASNQADSNIMEQMLGSSAFIGDFSFKEAEYVIVNTCSVKGPTENKVIDFIKKIPLPKYAIIICGCLVSDKKKKKEFSEYSLVSPYNVTKICDVIDYLKHNKKPIHLLSSKKANKIKFIPTNPISIVPILIGCLGNCTYCKTKQAKPLFFSYEKKEILTTIDGLIKNNCYEIWLSSEDNGAYGLDRKENYLDLLNAIEKKYGSSGVMFRFGMGNPEHIYKHLKGTKEFFENTKCFFKFLHIPIQSANNSVLKKMNRKYNKKQMEKIFSTLKNTVTISTDIICGFPTETESQFVETYNFIKKHKPLITNVSQFWVRPFTKAEKMKQHTSEVRKARSSKLSALQKIIIKSGLRSYKNTVIDVFVDEYKTPDFWGRTRGYVLVKIRSKKDLEMGKWHNLKIKGIESNHLVC